MKNNLLFLSILALTLVVSCSDNDDNSNDTVNLSQGLVAHYSLNGNADDASLNNFDGTITGNPELFENAISGDGNSYKFTNDNPFITTSVEIDNNLGSGSSFSAWVYLNDTDFTGRILSNFNGDDPNDANCNKRVGFVFGVTDNGAINVFYASSSPLYYGRITATESLETEKWHHIVATWDGRRTSSSFKIYIDGERRDVDDFQAGQETSFCDSYIQSDQPFLIGLGTCETGPCSPFKGAIDEVRIYDRVINSDEIESLSNE
ncbi:LamG domain-containing protein [Winogradskyella luteola]|uniref:LamG domain-containing protein n=1 Tax=Winogradskyella luteola TaxID=2828330 RepID=A0A9X1FB05_9FLAO|nr:LamG domain-containing protein [Winogradskyella luteola]MBV7270321.1 LamG domain-containing protein [Winogradskyella luteola]